MLHFFIKWSSEHTCSKEGESPPSRTPLNQLFQGPKMGTNHLTDDFRELLFLAAKPQINYLRNCFLPLSFLTMYASEQGLVEKN